MPANETIAFLRSFRLFQSLTNEELSSVAELCITNHYQRGEYIFLQSEEINHVFLQLQGRIRLFSMSESGSEQTFMIADEGELFPHVGFFRAGNYPYHAVALQDSTCISIPVGAFEQLLISNPNIHLKITQVLTDKILDLQRRLEDKTFYTTEGQLVSLLLRLTDHEEIEENGEKCQAVAALTNGELAGLLGTTRETVNRIINKLKKHKTIVIGKDGTMLIYRDRLQGMLPSMPNTVSQTEKWSAIRHHSDQCCISGGHEI